MKIEDVYAICDPVAEVQAILHDHLERGKHTPRETISKLHALMFEQGLLEAMWRVGYFPSNTPPANFSLPRRSE